MVSTSLTDAGLASGRDLTTRDSPMLIVCPSCTTSYNIEGTSLGPTGRSVRCVRCRNVWFARDPDGLTAIAEAHRSDIEAMVGVSAAPPQPEPPADPIVPAASAESLDTWSAEPANPDPDDPDTPATIEHEGPATAEPVDMEAPALAPIEQGDLPAMDDRPTSPLPKDAKRAGAGGDIESFARRRSPRLARGAASRGMTALVLGILALAALDIALVGWRAQVVRAAPQTASLYAALGLPVNLRGLTFNDVKSKTETHEGVQVLIVEGTIANVSKRTVEVPRLRFSVLNKASREVYAWTALPERSLISPGETVPFRSRLASPPHDTSDVLVRFFNRRDVLAGAQ
jgi:predicted Zn finger-like uncharacterized protein